MTTSPGPAAAWLEQATTTWIPVMEARPEVTLRRDSGSSAAWLAGKRVLVLGCGALGAPAAEICVRAGAAEVTVADNGIVRPASWSGSPTRTPTSASTRPPSWPGASTRSTPISGSARCRRTSSPRC